MRTRTQLFWALSLAALFLFLWPFWVPGEVQQDGAGAVLVALAAFALAAIAMFVLDGNLLGPKQLALLGTLAALGAAVRLGTSGVAGLELVFVVIILGGAAYGPRFGFLLGALTILLSSLFFGGFGPWTAFQIFASAWVGAGAGLIGSKSRRFRIALLSGYAILSSYLFGLLMNLWFWPTAVGYASSLSFVQGANALENLVRFLTFTLVSSTLTWDTVRAVSVALSVGVFGAAALRTLERAKI